jgi:hypothetical protein
MKLFLTTGTSSLKITNITLEIEFQLTWLDLQAYQGYFRSNDELMNRIWYSGAYTLQTNAVPVRMPFVPRGRANNNGTLGPPLLPIEQTRSHRLSFSDMGIAVSSISTGDPDSANITLQVMYNY